MDSDGYKIDIKILNRFEKIIINSAGIVCFGKRFHGYSKFHTHRGYTLLFSKPFFEGEMNLGGCINRINKELNTEIKVIRKGYNNWQANFTREVFGEAGPFKETMMVEVYIPVDREEQRLLLGLLRLKGI